MTDLTDFFNNTQNHFNDKGWVVIKNHLDKDMVMMAYSYAINKVKSVNHKLTYYHNLHDKDWDGGFNDGQVSDSYYCYGDVFMDTILQNSTEFIGKYLGMELVPTYSYWRLYEKGQELEKHRDRKSCEFSASLCLGYNTENLKDDYIWPFCLEDEKGKTIEVLLEPGDLLMYKGMTTYHWREPYKGLNHAQVFLHYNKLNDKDNQALDGRPMLGIPKEK